MVVTAAFLILTLVIVVVMMALALLILTLVIVMVVMVAIALLILTFVIVVVMMVAIALLILTLVIVVVMVVAIALLILTFVIVVVMVMTFALLILALVIVMMVMVMCLLHHMLHLLVESGFLLHSGEDLRTVQLIPISGYDHCICILLPQKGHALCQFRLAHTGGMAEDNSTRVLHLVVEKLTEVLHIHFALLGVHHGGKAVQLDLVGVDILHRTDYVAQLSHAGGLDQDALGGVVVDHLLKGTAEIAHQAAADTAGIHLRDLHTGLGEEGGVHADLAKLVLDQHQLFRVVRLGDQFLNESGFAGTEKAGKNINFSHVFHRPK